jgi:VanZ family protein
LSTLALQKPARAPQKSKLIVWLPTLFWLAMIACFSTDTFSSEHTGSILEKIVRAVYGHISPAHFRILHILVRKTAHFTVYGLLSWLAFYSWRTTLPRRVPWTFTWSILALLVTLVAGSADEVHQIFVPSRGPSPYDVMLDMMGAIFVQVLIASFSRFQSVRAPKVP